MYNYDKNAVIFSHFILYDIDEIKELAQINILQASVDLARSNLHNRNSEATHDDVLNKRNTAIESFPEFGLITDSKYDAMRSHLNRFGWTISHIFSAHLTRIRQVARGARVIRCDAGVAFGTAWTRGGDAKLGKHRGRARGEKGIGTRCDGRTSGREDVTQTVLGLSVRWIWHLEEQRPLTLRCGRAAACVVPLVRLYIHTSARECKSARVTAVRSLTRAGR